VNQLKKKTIYRDDKIRIPFGPTSQASNRCLAGVSVPVNLP